MTGYILFSNPGDNMWSPNDPRWLIPFSIFFAGVVGCLSYLHLSDAEQVPQALSWEGDKALYVCNAPAWVRENLDEAITLVEPWAHYTLIEIIDGPCENVKGITPVLPGPLKVDGRDVPYAQGAVLITMADGAFDYGTSTSGGHGDETIWSSSDGLFEKVTILFPEDLSYIASQDQGMTWPEDVEVLVISHALLHAEGFDHVFVDLPGPFSSEPTGHMMSGSISKLGFSMDGL